MPITVEIPEDVRVEFGNVPDENWQLLFSRFIRAKLDELRDINSIVSKSKATEEQINELANEVKSSIAKRFLKK